MTDSDAQPSTLPQRERSYRRNFGFFLADNILFNVAAGVISAATVIPDFVRRLTDSEILIGLSGSLAIVGNTLPQLLIARYIVGAARKQWWFVGPNIPARLMILIFAVITVLIGGGRPELLLFAFFICYGVAMFGDGLVGVPWAELAGNSLDNRWRARMLGLTTAVSGVILLLIAPLIGGVLGEAGPAFPLNYAILFGAAGLLFALSILPGIFIHELPGGQPVERLPPLRDYLPSLGRALRADGPFRAFIGVRIFMSLFLMANPFYIGYATVELGVSNAVAVPILLAMQTVGTVAGALAYTWLGVRSNLLVMRLALAGWALVPSSALLAGVVGPVPLYVGFLVSGMATSALFSGYLNWIVGYATPDQRPLYVGLSNTVAGVTALITPFIGGVIAQRLGYRPLFVVALIMALGGLFVTLRYISAAHDSREPG
ncbi:MAG: MFS transporter [Chloroflexi bacterium]|nr:MFS transporter [Chloroflexota bacterium]